MSASGVKRTIVPADGARFPGDGRSDLSQCCWDISSEMIPALLPPYRVTVSVIAEPNP